MMGCQSARLRPSVQSAPVYTMKTDLYPYAITRAEYYEQMALGYFETTQYDKATEYYKLALLHNPQSVQAYLGLSDVYTANEKYLFALIALQDAEEIDPKNMQLLKRAGDLYLKAGIYSKAREVYQKMLTLDNKDSEAQWAVFYIYKLERKYGEALETLARMNVTDQNVGQVWYEKAMIYKLRRDTLNYSQTIAQAIKLDPRNRDVLLEFVRFSYEKKSYAEATNYLLNYSNTHNFDYEVSEHLAFAAVQSGSYPIALNEYDKQKTVAVDPVSIQLKKAHCYFLMDDVVNAEKLYLKLAAEAGSDEARFYLGQIYYSKNKFADASFVLSQIPVTSDFFADAQVKMALYYKYAGDDDKAINILHDAFMARGDQLEIYKTYADFLIEQKRYVETVALIEKGIQLFPKDEELRLKMAYLHFRLNNQKSFKKQIKAALKINPESGDAYAMLSELWYLKERNVDETLYFVTRAMQLKTNNKNVKPIMAWALMQKNRSTEAVAMFEEFYEENPKESFFARSLSQVYRRGGVKEKAEKLSDLATRLEVDDSLKSRFIFRQQTQQVNAEQFRETKTRLPASLEN